MTEKLHPNQERQFFDDYVPEKFSREEIKTLEPFFTNVDEPVFVVKGLPSSIIGALIGRHSQTSGSMRRIFLDEFAGEVDKWVRLQKKGELAGYLNLEGANDLLERNFVTRGHDSLAAAVPLVVGFDGVSQNSAKIIEDVRIGASPIEQSSRYTNLVQMIEGLYLYARSPLIMNSGHAESYEKEINANLVLFNELLEPVAEAYQRKYPDESDWKIKRRTFDAVRVLLVAGNLTRIGVLVNGQAAENMIVKLRASELVEHQEIGLRLEKEIAKVSPPLVARLDQDFGREAIGYRSGVRKEQGNLAEEFLGGIEPERIGKGSRLIAFDSEGENKVIARMLWEGCDLSNPQVLEAVRQLSFEEKQEIVRRYVGQRPDRKIKPGRAFEEATLSYEIVLRFAEWRDLQRNRILTPYWRTFNYRLGFEIGDDLQEFGFGPVIEERLEKLAQAHAIIARDFPVEAQYMIAFGTLVPYEITLNFRELVHIAELRTGPGAHDEYAWIASEMARQGKDAYPLFEPAFQFVNWR